MFDYNLIFLPNESQDHDDTCDTLFIATDTNDEEMNLQTSINGIIGEDIGESYTQSVDNGTIGKEFHDIHGYYIESKYVDTDGNGIIDNVSYSQHSSDGDVFEYTEVFPYGNEEDTLEPLNDVKYLDFGQDDFVSINSGLPNFNHEEAYNNHENVIGNPAEDMKHWEEQLENGPCAIYAQMFALEELTGQEFNIGDLTQVAIDNGWYNEGGGTPIEDMGNLMEAFGLDVLRHDNGTFEDIAKCLEQGGKVVVAVDGDEIWYRGHDSSIFAPGDPNHAIEVIGVDYGKSGEPMVILNDSGTPDGCGEMVPLSQFLDAWKDSGYAMVEAYGCNE